METDDLEIGEIYCLKVKVASYLYYYSEIGIQDRKEAPVVKVVKTNEILDDHVLVDRCNITKCYIFKDNKSGRFINIYITYNIKIIQDFKNTRLRNIEKLLN